MNNVICLKVGEKYDFQYVNNLYHMVSENTRRKFNFYCFTDDEKNIDKRVECIKLPKIDDKKVFGWFYKLALFDPKINPLSGSVLYFDLDIVIINNIDCFFEFDSNKLCIIEDWIYKKYKKRKYNSSVMKWNTKNYCDLFENFKKNIFSKTYYGDQDFITEYIEDVNYWPENWCISYKWHNCEKVPPTPEAKIIVFHGYPKPHQINNQFVKNKNIL